MSDLTEGSTPRHPSLQTIHHLAHHLADTLPPSAELTVALRKLLESKDCAVRAAL